MFLFSHRCFLQLWFNFIYTCTMTCIGDSEMRKLTGRVSQHNHRNPYRRDYRLKCQSSYTATSNNMKLVHWPLMGGLLHLVRRGGDCAGPQPV